MTRSKAYDRLPKELFLPYPGSSYSPLPAFSPEPAQTALVIIDMQYGTAHRHSGLAQQYRDAGNFEAIRWRFDRIEQVVLPNLHRLIDYFRANKLLIVYVTLGSKQPDCSDAPYHSAHIFKSLRNWEGRHEHKILNEIEPQEGDIILNKTTVGAFSSTNIEDVLKQLGIRYLIFTGVGTEGCVDSTARAAADKGYHCIVVEDCVAGMKEIWHQVALVFFGRVFGMIMTTDEVLETLASRKAKLAASQSRDRGEKP